MGIIINHFYRLLSVLSFQILSSIFYVVFLSSISAFFAGSILDVYLLSINRLLFWIASIPELCDVLVSCRSTCLAFICNVTSCFFYSHSILSTYVRFQVSSAVAHFSFNQSLLSSLESKSVKSNSQQSIGENQINRENQNLY